MSNRSFIEINHDFGPHRDDDSLREFGRWIASYINSGDEKDLPKGFRLIDRLHHSDPEVARRETAASSRQSFSHGRGRTSSSDDGFETDAWAVVGRHALEPGESHSSAWALKEEAIAILEKWSRPSELRLRAGEMTSNEMRTVIAVLRGITSQIKDLK